MPFINKSYTSAVSDDILIDAKANDRVRILYLGVSNVDNATGTITIRFGTAVAEQAKLVDVLGAGGQIDVEVIWLKDHILGDKGKDVTVTTTLGVNANVFIIYEVLANVDAPTY